jgi:hypothetical protein
LKFTDSVRTALKPNHAKMQAPTGFDQEIVTAGKLATSRKPDDLQAFHRDFSGKGVAK